ncbi:MAG: homoserine dehydrogenase [Chloroflexota bacterium]
MKRYSLGLIGFGNVGQGLAQVLSMKSDWLAEKYGVAFQIVAVSDFHRGSIYRKDGFDPDMLLQAVKSGESLESLACDAFGWSAQQMIAKSGANIIVEMSYTDLKTGQPAISHVQQALESGKHVVTTNKGPIALAFTELDKLAAANGVQIGVEGTVMSGTPAIHLGLNVLDSAGITKIQGILNGTTNYMLTKMENGASYAEALADAQERGYAEADPTGDVEGIDAAGKVVILAKMLLGADIGMDDVKRTGISKITAADIKAAAENGERYKLVGSLEVRGGSIEACVAPMRLSLDHPLAHIGGATNAITYSTELMGDVTLVGAGAGRIETGYALLADMLAIHKSQPKSQPEAEAFGFLSVEQKEFA